jgi:hypothetical protein
MTEMGRGGKRKSGGLGGAAGDSRDSIWIQEFRVQSGERAKDAMAAGKLALA